MQLTGSSSSRRSSQTAGPFYLPSLGSGWFLPAQPSACLAHPWEPPHPLSSHRSPLRVCDEQGVGTQDRSPGEATGGELFPSRPQGPCLPEGRELCVSCLLPQQGGLGRGSSQEISLSPQTTQKEHDGAPHTCVGAHPLLSRTRGCHEQEGPVEGVPQSVWLPGGGEPPEGPAGAARSILGTGWDW